MQRGEWLAADAAHGIGNGTRDALAHELVGPYGSGVRCAASLASGSRQATIERRRIRGIVQIEIPIGDLDRARIVARRRGEDGRLHQRECKSSGCGGEGNGQASHDVTLRGRVGQTA